MITRANRFAYFNGKVVPIEEARVSVMTSALNYGTGIFEGIRGFWNAQDKELYVFRLQDHLARFARNMRLLLLDVPESLEVLSGAILELLRAERFEADIYIRPLAYKSSEVVGVRLHDLASAVTVFAVPFGEYIDRPDGASVMVSSWRRLADNAIPPRNKITGAYVNSALAKTEAAQLGFDDALFLCEDGTVSEASAANLFIARNGRLVTPPRTAGILEGITRASVMTLADDAGIPVEERPIGRSELYVADELLICGTAVGVVPVTSVDRRPVGDGRIGPLSGDLRCRYAKAASGRDSRHRDWCTPVNADGHGA
jgi:branched-chain amino acid aminotransferase